MRKPCGAAPRYGRGRAEDYGLRAIAGCISVKVGCTPTYMWVCLGVKAQLNSAQFLEIDFLGKPLTKSGEGANPAGLAGLIPLLFSVFGGFGAS